MWKIKRPELESKLVAEQIAEALEKRMAFRRAIKKAIQTTIQAGAKGVKVENFQVDMQPADQPDGSGGASAGFGGERDAAHQQHPYPEEQQDRQEPGNQVRQPVLIRVTGEPDIVLLQHGGEVRIDAMGGEVVLALNLGLEAAIDPGFGDGYLSDLTLFQVRKEFAVFQGQDIAMTEP